MKTNNSLIKSSEFEILSGQAGSGGGVGYVPLRTGMYEFMIGNSFIASASVVSTRVGTFSVVNDYVGSLFRLAEPISINRMLCGIGDNSIVGTIRGGIMEFDATTGFPTQVSNVITFVSNAFEDKTSFSANSVNTFTFSSTITLSANTWYYAGLQLRSVTSGDIEFHYSPFQDYGTAITFPGVAAREEGTSQGKVGSAMQVSLGFNNGTSTEIYFGELNYGSDTTINLFPTSTTNTQVGCKFQINLPIDEIFIKSILLFQHQVNTNHSIQCKIFTDSAGANSIGSSVIIGSTNLVTVAGGNRHRNYLFCPPVKIKTYKPYYAMWEITSGTATTTNPSRINPMMSLNSAGWDSPNVFCRRVNSTDANFTETSNYSLPIRIMFDTTRDTPRPHIGSM